MDIQNVEIVNLKSLYGGHTVLRLCDRQIFV